MRAVGHNADLPNFVETAGRRANIVVSIDESVRLLSYIQRVALMPGAKSHAPIFVMSCVP